MTDHSTRSNPKPLRISIDAEWRSLWGEDPPPVDSIAIGVVIRGEKTLGVLFVLRSGQYVIGREGRIQNVAQRAIKSALGLTRPPGRPCTEGGAKSKRILVPVDRRLKEKVVAAAAEQNISVSELIRRMIESI